jgi:WD40 repeat protein
MTAGTENRPSIGQRAKVFISYSRKDMAFADCLEAALKERGFEPLIDRAEIYAFEDWWKRIESLIVKADTMIFVLSPDAVSSAICTKEVAFAASLNKRFAPIVCRRVDVSAVPEDLRRLNFIFFDDPASFETGADDLAEALRIDIDWIRQHTEFGEQARRWAVAGRPGPRGLLLRSPALEEAERWIASRPHDAPAPTEETQAFVAESRRGATRRRNILTASLGSGLVLALALAGLAYWQRGIAVEQEQKAQEQRQLADQQRRSAEEQRRVAEKRRIATLAELGTSERLRGNFESALRFGMLAARLALSNQIVGDAESTEETALASTAWQSWRLVLTGHKSQVLSAAFSRDGQKIVTASADETVRIWNAINGDEIRTLQLDSQVTGAAFSPDGSRVITTQKLDNTMDIWDVASGQRTATLKADDLVEAADFSPNGLQIVAACRDKVARIWNASGKLLLVLRGHAGSLGSAAFSPDGSRVVTGSDDKTARVWNTATGQQLVVLRGHEDGINSVAYSSDGLRIVTASYDHTARIWDAINGREIAVLRGHEGAVRSAAYSPDGSHIVTASEDGAVRLWDAQNGQLIAVLIRLVRPVHSAAYSPDGSRIVTVSDDDLVRVWDSRDGLVTVLQGPEGNFSPDGSRVVTTSIVPAAQDKTASPDRNARIWDASGKTLLVLRGHTEFVGSASYSPDGSRVVTASADKTARIWDGVTGKQLIVMQGHQGPVYFAEFSPDGLRILTVSADKTARIWDSINGREIAILGGRNGEVHAATFSQDGTLVATGEDGAARIWDAQTGRQIAILSGHKGEWSAVFDASGSHILTSSNDAVQIWTVSNGIQDAVMQGAEGITNVIFSPDGARVLGAAHVWDAKSGHELFSLRGGDTANSAAYDHNGSRIVTTGSEDTSAHIWDAMSGREMAVLRTYESETMSDPYELRYLRSATFSPDSSRILTASGKEVRVWDVRLLTMPPKGLIAEVCARSLHGISTLSRDEMRIAGYPDEMPAFDVCADLQ